MTTFAVEMCKMNDKQTYQTVTRWSIIVTMVVMVVLSSCQGRSGGRQDDRDYETRRLEKIARLDSTSIRERLDPDTVEGRELLDKLTAEAWILIDDVSGCIISEKNSDKRMYMASLTKMMTCLLALENGCGTDTIEITERDYVAKDSRVRLGDSYILHDLIYEMMLVSDNDAAFAIANHIGGDTLNFCEVMNEKARYLGMNGTHYANPNGLPNDDNYSTARDLLALARYCMTDSAFVQIVGTAEQDVPLLDGRHLPCHNTNVLLSTYEGCYGIKTGFTYQAGACLAAAATRDGITLYVVLLKSKNMALRFKEAAILLDYGFNVMQNLIK